MTCTIVGWDNDIFSYAKETRRGGDWHNLVAVLAHEHDYSLGQALTEAVALRDRVLNAYLALRDQILGGASPHLARFIADLDAWNRGNVDWSANCGRYINTTDGSRSRITLTSQARETTLEPIPVPSVRWWWQCLADLDATTIS